MKPQIVILVVVLVALAGAVAWWRHFTRDARAMDNAAALVALSDRDTLCEVSDTNHSRKQKMQVLEVVAYLQRQLNVQSGSSIGVTASGKVTSDRVDAVAAELTNSGYKIAGITRVGFITEPEPRR